MCGATNVVPRTVHVTGSALLTTVTISPKCSVTSAASLATCGVMTRAYPAFLEAMCETAASRGRMVVRPGLHVHLTSLPSSVAVPVIPFVGNASDVTI